MRTEPDLKRVTRLCLAPTSTLKDIIRAIDENAIGVALVVSPPRRLMATITDGDIRRALLSGLAIDAPVSDLLQRGPQPARPVTVPIGTSATEILEVMKRLTLRQIPVVDDAGDVVDVAVLDELVKESALPVSAIIMAGGFGQRLRPLTDDLPKPMLPVAGRPVLELLLDQLRRAAVHRVYLSTHYKREVIERHFGDGHRFGLEIRYLPETEPRGTGGALASLRGLQELLLVINGDILTRVDFRAMIHFHVEHRAGMTVGLREYKWRIPYGVVSLDGVEVTGLVEKPVVAQFINAGLYVVDPDVHAHVPEAPSFDMTELVARLIAERVRVVGFPVLEYWIDIGHIEDYQRANRDLGVPAREPEPR